MYPPQNQKSRLCVSGGTYGDRLHPDSDPKLELETYIIRSRWEGSLYQALQWSVRK
jgi:hypothetical protein